MYSELIPSLFRALLSPSLALDHYTGRWNLSQAVTRLHCSGWLPKGTHPHQKHQHTQHTQTHTHVRRETAVAPGGPNSAQ